MMKQRIVKKVNKRNKEKDAEIKETKKEKIIILETEMQDPNGYLIPRNLRVKCKVEIADNVATFAFPNPLITKRWVMANMLYCKKNNTECETHYIEMAKKAITKYEGKTKEEICELIKQQITQMGINAKK